MSKRNIIIDTDACVDDLFAIALALQSPELDVIAITINGRGIESRVRAVCALLSVLTKRIPVFVGDESRLDPGFDHGHSALKFISRPPAILPDVRPISEILSLENSATGSMDVVALGPLSNVAAIIALRARLNLHVSSILIVGGSLQDSSQLSSGNNLVSDRRAITSVLASGIPLLFFPEEVTSRILLRVDHARPNDQVASDLAAWLFEMAQSWSVFHRRKRIKLHDVVPICHLLESTNSSGSLLDNGIRRMREGTTMATRLPWGSAVYFSSRLGIPPEKVITTAATGIHPAS